MRAAAAATHDADDDGEDDDDRANDDSPAGAGDAALTLAGSKIAYRNTTALAVAAVNRLQGAKKG